MVLTLTAVKNRAEDGSVTFEGTAADGSEQDVVLRGDDACFVAELVDDGTPVQVGPQTSSDDDSE